MSSRAAAKRFEVGVATAICWAGKYRTADATAAKPIVANELDFVANQIGNRRPGVLASTPHCFNVTKTWDAGPSSLDFAVVTSRRVMRRSLAVIRVSPD
jgi:hypothetical protein